MPIFAITANNFLGGFASLVYGLYPNRIQKGNRLGWDAEDQLMKDIVGAKKKIIIICRNFFTCKTHPSLDMEWFIKSIDELNKNKVAVIMASEEDPPEFIQSLIDSGKICFKKSERVPFVGHFVDDKIIDISFDDRQTGICPGGIFWRTEHALPDINELLKDAFLASISYSFERLV